MNWVGSHANQAALIEIAFGNYAFAVLVDKRHLTSISPDPLN